MDDQNSGTEIAEISQDEKMAETETGKQDELAADEQALCGQLALLDNSQALMRTIFLGLAMQYKVINEQRCRLLEGREIGNDIKSVQIAASLIVLSALFGFQSQAQSIAEQTCAAGVCPDNTELTAGALVITAALIRIFKLAGSQNTSATPARQQEAEGSAESAAEETEDLEEIAEPAI